MYKKQRNESTAIIGLEGRDVKNQRFNVSFDSERCIWSLDSVEQNLKPPTENPLLKDLFSLLSNGQPLWQGTASELIDTLELVDITPNVMMVFLWLHAVQKYRHIVAVDLYLHLSVKLL